MTEASIVALDWILFDKMYRGQVGEVRAELNSQRVKSPVRLVLKLLD
jgi:hypothetical protein